MSRPNQSKPEAFPELNTQNLKEYAEEWVGRYPSIKIDRVTLYRYDTTLQDLFVSVAKKKNAKLHKAAVKAFVPVQYAIVFAISDCSGIPENELEYPYNIEYEGTPENIECIKLMKDCHQSYNYTSFGRPHPFLDSAFIKKVITHTPIKDFRKEWGFYYTRPKDKKPLYVLKNKAFLILYDPTISIEREKSESIDYAFLKEGPSWKITYEKRTIAGLTGKGFGYIHYLVKNPRKEFHTEELKKEVEKISPESIRGSDAVSSKENNNESIKTGKKQTDHRDMVTRDDKKKMIEQRDDLAKEVRTAEDSNDPNRIEKARKEYKDFIDYFAKLLKPNGKSRKFVSATTRTMQRITKSIERALKTIEEHDESAWRHFNSALRPIRTYSLSYNPDRNINCLTD